MVFFSDKILRTSSRIVLLLLMVTSLPTGASESDDPFVVVLDPGHGGKDPGALGSQSQEKEIVLAIALQVGAYINEYLPDVEVIYTRDTDIFIPLHERADIANRHNADLFISIHANASVNPKVYGTETFAMGLHRSESNLEVAKRENKVILYEEDHTERYEGFDPTSAESYIIFSLLQNTHLNQSLEYASFVQREFESKAKRHSRGVKQAGFLILWKTKMPSALVEIGYITNTTEEAYLLSETGQSYISSAIFRAFRAYKERIEKSSNRAGVQQTRQEEEPVNLPFFAIQVMTTSRLIKLTPDNFQGLDNIRMIQETDLYKYIYGNSHSYEEISTLKQSIQDDFPDAFIVAVQGKQIIPLGEAIQALEKHQENP